LTQRPWPRSQPVPACPILDYFRQFRYRLRSNAEPLLDLGSTLLHRKLTDHASVLDLLLYFGPRVFGKAR
jgi:hypothetical protein